jgi:Fe2+ or Zn2+ uptake regulation protein
MISPMSCASSCAPQTSSSRHPHDLAADGKPALAAPLTWAHIASGRLHAARQCRPHITRPTVCRALEFLAEDRLVWRTHLPEGHFSHELAEKNHTHLVCRRSGAQLQIKPALFDDIYRELEAMSGDAVNHKHPSISGLCPKCRPLRATMPGGSHSSHVS